MNLKRLVAAAIAVGIQNIALADINIGVAFSLSGPGASVGIQEKNAVAMMPDSFNGERINYIVLDDESDPAKAIRNVRKLITENKIDVLIGASLTPISIALVDVVGEAQVPMISPSASPLIVAPMDKNRKWTFKTTQNDALMAAGIMAHMKKTGLKTVAYIGQSDSYGEGWFQEVSKNAAQQDIKLVASERFARTDTSATAQVLKVISAKPDAIVIAGAGTPSLLPHLALADMNYKGRIYQSHGAANSEFMKIGSRKVDKTFLAVGPMLVAEQLPESAPTRAAGLEFVKAYETKYGPGSRSTFAGHAWDAWLLLKRAIPEAMQRAKPGTPEFRSALRDSIESTKEYVGTHGIFNMTAQDHMGLDKRAAVMVQIQDGKWVLVP